MGFKGINLKQAKHSAKAIVPIVSIVRKASPIFE